LTLSASEVVLYLLTYSDTCQLSVVYIDQLLMHQKNVLTNIFNQALVLGFSGQYYSEVHYS